MVQVRVGTGTEPLQQVLPRVVLAAVSGYPAAVRVGTGTVTLVPVWNGQGTEPGN